MKYKNCKIVIIGTILLAFLFISIPQASNTNIVETPRISSTYVPSGLIALWSGTLDSIPDGWILCDGTHFTPNTTDKFVFNTDGVEDAGSTGGTSTHSHSYTETPYHDHGVSGVTTCAHSHGYTVQSGTQVTNYAVMDIRCMAGSGYTSYESAPHSHTTTLTGLAICNTDQNHEVLPPYYKLAYIQKTDNNPFIPAGIIMIWSGLAAEIPQNWAVCNGSQGTPDLEGRFVMGVGSQEDPGATGGNLTHSHTYSEIPQHSHTLATSGASHRHSASVGTTYMVDGWPLLALTVGIVTNQYTSYTDVPHVHTMNPVGQVPPCSTQETNHEPPFTTMTYIMNTQESVGIPTGTLCFWGDTVANIPIGWSQCDGTGTTNDLTDKFLKGSSLAEPHGATGGSSTHTHVYTEIPLHNHNVISDNMRHSHTLYQFSTSVWSWDFLGPRQILSPSHTSASTSTASAPHSHDILPAGVMNPHTDPESNLPPFIELTYLNYTSPMTSIEWVSPDADANILFPRSPTVQFDFEYSWLGIGNDITLSFTNGTNNYDAGSVIGLDHAFIPYLAGNVEATFHLMQDATELTIATRSFLFYNNRNPTVTLVQPNGGEELSGIYEVTWTGSDQDGDQLYYTLEYNIADTGWVEIISGITGMSYNWNTTTALGSDSVKFRVTAEDAFGGHSSDESDAIFSINNGSGNGNGDKPKIPGYSITIIVSLFVVTCLYIARKRKK